MTTNLNRRRLLLGLATASTIAASGALVAASPATAAAPTLTPENPELLRLAARLAATARHMERATLAYRHAYRKAMKAWPVAPDSLVTDIYRSDLMERDIRGAAMMPDKTYPGDGQRARSILTSADLRSELAWIDRQLTRKRRKPLTDAERAEAIAYRDRTADRVAEAEAYEGQREAVKRAVDWEAKAAAETRAQTAMQSLVAAIMAERAETMEGVLIKADAIADWHRYPLAKWLSAGSDYARDLATELMRIAEREGTDA